MALTNTNVIVYLKKPNLLLISIVTNQSIQLVYAVISSLLKESQWQTRMRILCVVCYHLTLLYIAGLLFPDSLPTNLDFFYMRKIQEIKDHDKNS